MLKQTLWKIKYALNMSTFGCFILQPEWSSILTASTIFLCLSVDVHLYNPSDFTQTPAS